MAVGCRSDAGCRLGFDVCSGFRFQVLVLSLDVQLLFTDSQARPGEVVAG